MMKILIIAIILVIGTLIVMADKPKNPTKIPYNNGFYAGPYNPKLPVIKP